MKYGVRHVLYNCTVSPPVWGAWIEIAFHAATYFKTAVAPRMGGVD